MKKKDHKQYKFINNESDNIIFFLTIPDSEPDPEKILEETRQKLAVENGVYIGNIHYITVSDHEFEE